MRPSQVLRQLAQMIEEGRIHEDVAGLMLTRSGVIITAGSKQGTFDSGMLNIGGGLHSADVLGLTGFSMPPVEETALFGIKQTVDIEDSIKIEVVRAPSQEPEPEPLSQEQGTEPEPEHPSQEQETGTEDLGTPAGL